MAWQEFDASSQNGCCFLETRNARCMCNIESSGDFENAKNTPTITDCRNEWDYLEDGYYTQEEREDLRDLVINEKLEMLGALDLGAADLGAFHWHRSTQLLGVGSFGCVYQAINHVTGEILAVKEVVGAKSHIRAVAALRTELDTLRQLRHPNIVCYRGMFEREDSLCVAMEYCPGGSLSSVLAKFGALDDDVARNYTGQILCGLDYLHRHCIVHRDIKCPNVLLGAGGVVKLADFGASKRLHALCTASLQGTARYIAPEVLRRESVGRQSDIWSVGCCVVEMYSLSLPHDCQFSNDLAFMQDLAGLSEPPPLPPGLPADAADFVGLCLAVVPSLRPSAHRLLRHPYITSAAPARADPPADGDAVCPDVDAGSETTPSLAGSSLAPHSLAGGGGPLHSRSNSAGGDSAAEGAWLEGEAALAGFARHGPAPLHSCGSGAPSLDGDSASATPRGAADGPCATHASGARHNGFVPGGRPPPPGSADWHGGGPAPPLSGTFSWDSSAGSGSVCSGRSGAAAAAAASGPPGWSPPPPPGWSIDHGERAPEHRSARARRDDAGGSSLHRRRRPPRVPLKRSVSSLFGADRFADSGQEGEYRRMWREQAAQGVLASSAWPVAIACLAVIDLRLLLFSGGSTSAIAAAAAAAAVYLLYPLARAVIYPGKVQDPELLYGVVLWWVRAVEAVGIAMSLRPDPTGGDLAVVVRMAVATLGGVEVKLSLTEHVAAVLLTSAAYVVAVAGGTLAGGTVPLLEVPTVIAAAVRTLCAHAAVSADIANSAERQRATLAVSSMLVLAAAAAGSILYAARAQAEARFRFRQDLIKKAEAEMEAAAEAALAATQPESPKGGRTGSAASRRTAGAAAWRREQETAVRD